ncbi:hypothetical protein HYFRA_00010151 [Hymenoscyphus fraxineus]|uniref:Uncharacterized protein n=1 Tax=Hymenoscyphus fraxineus TaxID=746836 RepID=A0A9N9KV15_9HELO|nr:hypothetical protein HYFRA_00010151 [Hymenoscyphus fraxineus]
MLQDMGLSMDGIRDAAATATPTATAWFLIVSTGMTMSLMLDNGLSRFHPSSKVVGRQRPRISDLPADQRVQGAMCLQSRSGGASACRAREASMARSWWICVVDWVQTYSTGTYFVHTVLRASLATAAPAHADEE